MIQVQDLMVGNYLKWKDNGSIFELTIDIFCDKNFQNHLSSGDFELIFLSEEILLKCGFECIHIKNKHFTINDPNGVKDLHKISIFPTVNNQWHIAFSDMLNGYKDYIPTTKIKYLHELQQLYKILTKQELEIKL